MEPGQADIHTSHKTSVTDGQRTVEPNMSRNSALLTRNQREQLEELAGEDSEHDVRVAATTALLDDAHGRLAQARELCTTPDGEERSPAFSSLLRRSEERVSRVGERLQQLVNTSEEANANQDDDKDSQETLVLNLGARPSFSPPL